MPVDFNYLNNVGFSDIYQCFMEAFANYHLDMSYMNKNSLFNRMKKNGVDFGVSVGAFDKGKLVGFTLVGADVWKGKKTAFDAATGIIPSHQGRGIANKMFRFSLPKLKEQGFKTFLLEVLRVNEAGIKAYQRIGFNITRQLECFELPVDQFNEPKPIAENVVIRPVGKDLLPEFVDHLDWLPSWENSFASIERIPDQVDIWGAFDGDTCVGLLAYYPALKWVLTIVVKREYRRRGIGGQLFSHCVSNLPKSVSIIKALNIEQTDSYMIQFVKQLGFKESAGQYEMAMDIV